VYRCVERAAELTFLLYRLFYTGSRNAYIAVRLGWVSNISYLHAVGGASPLREPAYPVLAPRLEHLDPKTPCTQSRASRRPNVSNKATCPRAPTEQAQHRESWSRKNLRLSLTLASSRWELGERNRLSLAMWTALCECMIRLCSSFPLLRPFFRLRSSSWPWPHCIELYLPAQVARSHLRLNRSPAQCSRPRAGCICSAGSRCGGYCRRSRGGLLLVSDSD
jgi:hypothetical protein